MPAETPSFRFKFGRVEVTPERLVLVQDNVRGRFSNAVVGRSTRRSWVVQSIVLAIMAWMGVDAVRRGDLFSGVLLLGFAGWVLYYLLRYRDYTLARELDRAKVTRVEAVRGLRFLTLDRLVVHFMEEGRPRRRFINMPTTLQGGGPAALEASLRILREAGWPVYD